jgi:uncharacterized protein (DUF697 family)
MLFANIFSPRKSITRSLSASFLLALLWILYPCQQQFKNHFTKTKLMYHNSRHHRRPWNNNNNNNCGYDDGSGSEMEGPGNNTEFNYESNYEMAPGFEISEEGEYNPSYESTNEGTRENAAGGSKDEMEEELEYITNEQEFENWVHGITRDHRNLRSVLGHPLGQMALRHFTNIAPGAVRGLGMRRGGWQGQNRGYLGGYNNRDWQRRGYRDGRRSYRPFGSDGLPAQSFPEPDGSQQQSAYPGSDTSQPSSGGGQDSSFKNFVLGTLQNLSQQISSGNDTVSALKNSMANSAASNFPSIAQPAADPAGGTPSPAPPPAQGSPAQGAPQQQEYGRQGYEYNLRREGEIGDSESSFSEETEMELASELLTVNNDSELDHFLGDLLKKAVGAVSGLLGGGQGNILKNIIGTVAKKVLPIAGTAAGTIFGGPIGAAIGGNLGQAASGLFEMEMEGMSNEDREFEVARAVVRFGGNAARQVEDSLSDNPQEDVRQGVIEAAKRFAPGLLIKRKHHHHHHDGRGYDNRGSDYGGYGSEGHDYPDNDKAGRGSRGLAGNDTAGGQNGTWYRKGNKIIIENI